MLNLFFAFRFYRRYKKLLVQATSKVIESLKKELSEVWEERLDSILAALRQLMADTQSQISTISGLKREGP